MFIDFLLEGFKINNDRTALIWQDKEYSYRWLLNEYDKAWEILIDNKIYTGKIVALRSDFTPCSIAFLLALIENGNIFVPISYAVKNPEEFYHIAQVEYKIELESSGIPKISDRNVKVDHPILRELIENRHPGLILFSSGSTGKSKAAVHDFIPLLEKFKVKRHTLKTITFLLFDHIGGVNTLLYILSNSGTIITPMSREPEEICRLIEKFKVELLPTSPSFLNMMIISRVYEKYDLSSLKMITYGTETMPEYLLKKIHNLYPKIKLKQTYGLSELGILRSKSQSDDSLWVKVGGEGFQIKVVNGILFIKAKSAMLGYLNAPSPFDEEGWFNTQDKVEVNGEWIKILGRETDIINVGGQKVYPAEVESVLMEIDNIVDASVYGEKNPIMGDIVSATITLKNNEDLISLKRRIRQYCRNKLESYKIPVTIKISDKQQISDRFKKVRK